MGIFWGSPIELTRPDGVVTFTGLHKASTPYYELFRLLRASAIQKAWHWQKYIAVKAEWSFLSVIVARLQHPPKQEYSYGVLASTGVQASYMAS
jgi:hypothetical protein